MNQATAASKPLPDAAGPGAAAGEHSDDAATSVVSMYVKQQKIYPRAVSGWFAGWRWAMVWATQLVFYGLPWLQWNDRQAVLFDLGARRFYIFGMVLYPQDFIYLTALLIISAYSLFLFTAVAGRLWCGFACPQTVYTEIFMWVERKIQGDRVARMRRDAAPWSLDKGWRALAKQAAWIAIALVDRLHLRRLLHADPHAGRPGRAVRARALGDCSGCCSTGWPPTAMPASCASRCASTCAPTRASRA